MKILLWKIGALGDVLMTTPLVRQLRQATPSAHIDYLTGHKSAAILRSNPHLDRVVEFDEQILIRPQTTRLREILQALRGYDVVFILDKHWIFEILAWWAGVPQRVGFMRRRHEGLLHTHSVGYGSLRHEILYYLDLARAWGVSVDMTDVKLQLPQVSEPAAVPPCQVLVNSGGINVHERSDARRMPDALFGELAEHCAALGPVTFLGGPEEHAYYERFKGASRVNLSGLTTLPQAWSTLASATAIYSTDSGLMHMAGALNPKLTAIFGPTHPARKCPPGARWAWRDHDRYDSRYELFGTVPKSVYFQRMTLSDILEAHETNPLDLQETAGESSRHVAGNTAEHQSQN
jgi:ADP-heptose:LPS heptosyltransferase